MILTSVGLVESMMPGFKLEPFPERSILSDWKEMISGRNIPLVLLGDPAYVPFAAVAYESLSRYWPSLSAAKAL